MKKSILIAVVVYCGICAVMFIACCKKKCNDVSNPECGNYDPCYSVQKITADFDIYERSFYSCKDSLWLTDTTVGTDVVFEAKLENAISYEWKIGAGKYYKKKFELSFNSVADSTVIPIQLTVHKKPDYTCYPATDSIVTFTKNMYLDRTNNKYYGRWEGYYSDSPNIKSIINIKKTTAVSWNGQPPKGSADVFGLYPGCDTTIAQPGDSKYKNILCFRTPYMTSSGFVFDGYMIVDVETNNNIIIDYDFQKFGIPLRKRTFVGKRIK